MLVPEVFKNAERRVGQTVGGKWQLDRVIGVGGMAAVYEATHRNRNRVAIKLLHPTLSLDQGTRHRFLREGYVANTIRHDGAVQVLDDDVTEDGVAFLVMELLEGESVEQRMNRKGGLLELSEALKITEDLLDVLAAAHDQGVVHRDIKPDNLFLTESGQLKVLDFGIARLHQGDSSQTKVGSFMGTPAYCAPEQARGRWDEVDARTDLFSVGANLFACVTGRHVHEAETSSEQLALAISATAPSLREALPDAPVELVELVDRALSYNKDDRFQSARAMKAAVARVRAGLGNRGWSPTPQPSSDPPSLPAGVYPPAGAITALEGDSVIPSPSGSKTTLRVLVGLLVAGVLAVFLLVANQQSSAQSADAPSVQARSDASEAEQPVVAPEPASSAQEAPPEDALPGEDVSGEEPGAMPVEKLPAPSPPSSSDSPPKSAPSPSAGSTPVTAAPAPRPAHEQSPSDEVDEDMIFGRRH